MSVNSCEFVTGSLLLAVIVKTYVPAGIVPTIVIMPFAGLILTPVGAPVSVYVIGVEPDAVIWNVLTEPLTTLALFALVITGA